MKKFLSVLLAAVLGASLLAVPASAVEVSDKRYDYTRFKGQDITLNVYNWGLYISDGSDESEDVVKAFEELTGIDVNYTTYDTNESLYAKLKSGGADYDVIIPSDYMIGKMRNEGMLAELDMDNIPNYKLIGDAYKGLSYDPEEAYSVPYMWGLVGLVYNTTMVEDAVDSWSILWDPAYTGNILMFNNSRDAFAIAQLKSGLSLNPSTQEEIDKALAELKDQKIVVQAYVMDEIFDKMIGGEAALAPYYAGDAVIMMEDNPDLAFAFLGEGTNYFVDAMCIPATSQHKEAAEMFINFMCEPEVALANCEFIGYSTPIPEVREMLPEEMRDSEIMYPADEVLANTQVYSTLPDEINAAMDTAWSQMKSYDEGGSAWVMPVFLLMAVAIIILQNWRKHKKRKQNNY